MNDEAKRGRVPRVETRIGGEPFGLPRPCYVILNPKGEYFRDFAGSTPAALHSFTDSFANARKLYDPDEARGLKKRVLGWLVENDGEKEVPRDYLRVAEVACRAIDDGEEIPAEGAGGRGEAAGVTPVGCGDAGAAADCGDGNADERGMADCRYCVNLETVHGTIVEVRARDEEDAERRVIEMWERGRIAMDKLSFREVRISDTASLGG